MDANEFKKIRIVNIEDVNVEKENVIPLPSGRSAAKLQDKFTVSPSTMVSTSEKQEGYRIARFEKSIAEMNLETEDDPLDLHYQYVHYLQEEFTQGHPDLMRVVERAVRQFRKDERYKNDPRYLKLWLLVARNTKEPTEVFKYLSINRIGIQNATYYEEYASYMESCQRYSEASNIFEQGISRKAQPYERLVKRFQDFKTRTKGLADVKPQNNSATSSDDVLQPIHSVHGSRNASRSNVQTHPGNSLTNKSKKETINVYRDLTDSTSNPLPTEEVNAGWDDYVNLSIGKKENYVKPEKMVGSTLKQDISNPLQQKLEFRVFRDTKPAPKNTKAASSSSSTSVSQSNSQKRERLACDLSLLYIGEEEFSLEEIRALRLGYSLMDDDSDSNQLTTHHHAELGQANHLPTSSSIRVESSGDSARHRLAMNSDIKTNSEDRKTSLSEENVSVSVPFPTKIESNAKMAESTVDHALPRAHVAVPSLSIPKRQMSSPTINTKAAMEDVFQMFNQSVFEQADAEDATISSKVYRPDMVGFTIPKHFDDDDFELPEQPHLQYESQHHKLDENLESTKSFDKLFSDKPFPIFNDENESKPIEPKVRAPLAAKTIVQDENHQENYVFQGSRPKDYPIESTPHIQRSCLSRPGQGGIPSMDYTASRQTGHPLQRIPQQFDLMTPIAEVSYEDPSFAALSTIRRLRVDDMDPLEHTATTIADRTILSCRDSRDRTLSSITEHEPFSLDGSNSSRISSMPAPLSRSDDIYGMTGENNELEGKERFVLGLDHLDSPVGTPNEKVIDLQDLQKVHDDYHPDSKISKPVCNPRSKDIMNQLMMQVLPYLRNLPNLCDCRHESTDIFDRLNNVAKSLNKSGNRMNFQQPVRLQLKGLSNYLAVERIGSGAYGNVYLLKDAEDAHQKGHRKLPFGDEEEDSDQRKLSALKIQQTIYPWEFYILSQIRERLPAKFLESVIAPFSCHVYQNGIFLRLQYLDQGTIVDTVNYCGKDGYGSVVSAGSSSTQTGLDELLAMFWTVELMRALEKIQEAGIIHGDLKADNILVRIEESCFESRNQDEFNKDVKNWSSNYSPLGEGGWISKGITILDWGSAIDTRLFSSDQQFVCPMDSSDDVHSKTKKSSLDPSVECWEMRNGQTWKYNVDWYGLAGIAHVMLFGKYMEVKEGVFPFENNAVCFYDVDFLNSDICPRIVQTSTFKRYWQMQLWDKVFDLLLNAGIYNRMLLNETGKRSSHLDTDMGDYEREFPIIKEIQSVRLEMEQWLEANCNKAGKSLKNLLRKVEVSCLERR